jgi:hypothetical protein
MSLAQEAQTRAREIRARLIRPPNAVADPGIDLHRIPPGMRYIEKKRTEPEQVLEYRPSILPESPTTKVLVPFKSILSIVAQYFGMGIRDITGLSRKAKYTHPRHIAVYLMTLHTDLSYSAIGLKLYRDHSTIMHANNKMKGLVATDSNIAETIKELQWRLLNEQHEPCC